jgi:hypothetical protein
MVKTDTPPPPSRVRGNIAFALVSLSFGIVGVYGAALLGAQSELWGYRHYPSPNPQPSFEVLLWLAASVPVCLLYMPLVYALALHGRAAAGRLRGYLIALAPIVVPIAVLAISNSPFFLLAALFVAVLSMAFFEYARWIDAAPYRATPAMTAAAATLATAAFLFDRIMGYSPLVEREPADPWALLILPLVLVLPLIGAQLVGRLFRPAG